MYRTVYTVQYCTAYITFLPKFFGSSSGCGSNPKSLTYIVKMEPEPKMEPYWRRFSFCWNLIKIMLLQYGSDPGSVPGSISGSVPGSSPALCPAQYPALLGSGPSSGPDSILRLIYLQFPNQVSTTPENFKHHIYTIKLLRKT
jgi:hypothetical protein